MHNPNVCVDLNTKLTATSLLPNPSTEEELVTALEEEQVIGESMAITAMDVDSDSLSDSDFDQLANY